MEVTRAQNGAGLQTVTDNESRDLEKQNAMKQFQAVYGAKPKEARPVKKTLDKDDFMKIMIAEMKHQDPTKPMDSDRMATQMAQITSVEQMKNVGAAVEKLADKNSTTDRLAMSSMIGKAVTVDKGRFNHQKSTISPINFDLPDDAEKIKLTIVNERGDEVAVKELEPMKKGPNIYNWDGINASNVPSLTGTYMVRIDAENAKGAKIKIDPIAKESIVGVSFEGGETNFLVGDTKNPQKVAFKSVIRIDNAMPAQPRAQRNIGQERVSEAAPVNASTPETNDAQIAAAPQQDVLPAGLQEKMKAELAQRAEENNEVKAEGFPNGLGD